MKTVVLFTALQILFVASGIAAAQTGVPASPNTNPGAATPLPTPPEKFDNRPIGTGSSIATDPDPPANSEATNPPGAKGPVEGGSNAPNARVISPKEGTGVENPGVGAGNNGSTTPPR